MNEISEQEENDIIREAETYLENVHVQSHINTNSVQSLLNELGIANDIGDEDFVIDMETAPIVPTYQSVEQVVASVIDTLDESESAFLDLTTAHIDEILEDMDEVNSENEEDEEDIANHENAVAQASNPLAIRPNSNSILVSETTSRFSSATWYLNIQTKTVLLAGIGGIGSYVGFLLSRLNIGRLIIYDDDIVDTVNLSGQLYSSNQISLPKTSSLVDMMSNYSEFRRVTAMREKFLITSPGTEIMICGFDNMTARKNFFAVWKNLVMNTAKQERSKFLYIDGRLAAEEYQVFCLIGSDSYSIEKYENEYLFSDAEADETICSYKQTTFMANQIASTIVNLFVNFVANQCDPIIDRYLPFYTEYNAETMYFKTIS